MFEAGGGRIGDYERCSWYAAGTGTFFGGERHEPAVGESGREEHVAELRVETVVPEARIRDAIVALRLAHPYEEPAYDVYPLARPVKAKLFTDGGSRGNPGRLPTRSCSRPRTAPCSTRGARRSASRRTTSPSTRRSSRGSSARSRSGVDELEVVSDSELLVKQMRGEYRVKNRALQDLFLDASRSARKIRRVTYTAVRREHNSSPTASSTRRSTQRL